MLSLFQFHSDEPTLEDHLEHSPHVEAVGKLIESCQPPYVLGIHGDWGSGKTSFLRKLHLYLAGARSGYPNASELGKRLWRSSYTANRPYETIWFEAWRYQFEPNPVVALLNEIRAHFTWSRRLVGEAGKLTFAALMSIEDLTKKIGLQPSKIQEGGERWEREQLAQPLPSQVCRDLLEQAIKTILGKGRTKRLIIFVDDLDRCQGQVAFRLLEAMKIYLSISSCIFVLGLDLRNVQQAVASELKRSGMVPDQGSVAPEIYAADYLSKLFQSVYHLPALSRPEVYLRSVLRSTIFGDKLEQWIEPMAKYALLPSNPRKIKSFVNGLALYLSQLERRLVDRGLQLDVQLALIVTYMNLLAHEVYRIVESDADFWPRLVQFCRDGQHGDHLALKSRRLAEVVSAAEGETGYTYSSAFRDPADESVFRVARLMREWRGGARPTDDEFAAYFLRSG